MPLTYSNVRDITKRKLGQIGLNTQVYSTHSLRSGGASAASNHDMSDRLLQRHGRWAGSSSASRYLDDNLTNRLSVSQCIGTPVLK
jgi:hypothetical protein